MVEILAWIGLVSAAAAALVASKAYVLAMRAADAAKEALDYSFKVRREMIERVGEVAVDLGELAQESGFRRAPQERVVRKAWERKL